MALEVYLYFDGNAREAVTFYSTVFETPLKHIETYADMPDDSTMTLPDKGEHLIMNTSLMIQGTSVMFSDVYPEMGMKPLKMGNNVALIVTDKTKEGIIKLFNLLKEGGQVENELEETFWSPLYGRLCDKFGVCWELMVYDSGTSS